MELPVFSAQPPRRLAGGRAADPLGLADREGALGAARGWDRGADRVAGARLVFPRGALRVDGPREGPLRIRGVLLGAARVAGARDGAARDVRPRGADRVDGALLGVARDLGVRLGVAREGARRLRPGLADRALRGATRELGVPRAVAPLRLGVARVDGVVRVDGTLRAAPLRGMRLGRAAEGRLAGPPRVVRPTSTGLRPTVGVLVLGRSPTDERPVLAAVPPRTRSAGRPLAAVRRGEAARGALRPTDDVVGRARRVAFPVPEAAAVRADTAAGVALVGRRCAVLLTAPFGFSLYLAPTLDSGDGR